MPIYTYRCENCGVQFEQNQKFTDDHLTRCPECGKKALRKVYTPVGIVFKGSGFYSTDNRSPSGMNYNSSKAEEKAAENVSKKETKNESDTKAPATKTETGDSSTKTESKPVTPPPVPSKQASSSKTE